MPFVNTAVDLDSLPRAEETPLHPVDARYPWLAFAGAAIVAIPAFLAAGVFLLIVPPFPLVARLALVVGAFVVLSGIAWHAYRAASVFRYALRDHDVIVRTGIFWRKETVQPIRRIQHVEQAQGPLEKRLGLSTLRMYSAGSGRVMVIPGLESGVAAAMASFILGYADQQRGEEPAVPVAGPEAAPHA
jgi:membrane protein YdbS with pleckstrin-like domain